MAGLLDFVTGFGMGAAGGYVEQKKADIQAMREANLAKLRAEYGTEQAKDLAKFKVGLEEEQFESATEGLPENQKQAARLARLGIQMPTAKKSTLQAEAEWAHPNDPEAQRRYVREMRLKPDTEINLTRDARGDVTMEKLLEADAERVEQLEDRMYRAQSQITQADRLEAALEGNFKTGIAAPPVKVLSQIATYAGLDPDSLGLGSAATADTIEAASRTLAANLIGDITDNSSLRGSASLMRMLEEAGPMLTRTPEGNRVIVEVMRGGAERDIEVAALANQYISDYGTLRPKDAPSFTQKVIELNKEDPIITDKLRERIKTAKDIAPKGSDLIIETQEIPKLDIEYSPPEGQTGRTQYAKDLAEQLIGAGLQPGQQWRDKNGRLIYVPDEQTLKSWGIL